MDGAHSSATRLSEYRGVDTASKIILFHQGPFMDGTNNVMEFLALVHALAMCTRQKTSLPVYSDSVNAIKCNNTLYKATQVIAANTNINTGSGGNATTADNITSQISNLLNNIKLYKSESFSGQTLNATETVTLLSLPKGRYLIMYNGYNSLYGGYIYKGDSLVAVGWVRYTAEITLNQTTVLRVQAGTGDPVTWTNYQLVAIKVG